MTEERNGVRVDGPGDVAPAESRQASSSDLLDLVRAAEADARLALRKRTPPVPMRAGGVAGQTEEVVDVGDEAVDAPPSLPPASLATSVAVAAPHARLGARDVPAPLRGLPTTLGLALALAVAVIALVLFAR